MKIEIPIGMKIEISLAIIIAAVIFFIIGFQVGIKEKMWVSKTPATWTHCTVEVDEEGNQVWKEIKE